MGESARMAKKELPRGPWALEYDMQHASRGTALIFNNVKSPNSYWDNRLFSLYDGRNLESAFEKIGFEKENRKVCNDSTVDQMMQEIKQVAAKDHSNMDCVIVVFLAYGEHNLVYAKDKPMGIQKLLEPLKGDKCHKSLVGKPKIIMVQTDNPELTIAENDNSEDKSSTVQVRHVIPTEADFVYLGSEMPGLISGRDMKDGSIFISHLAKNIKELGASTEIRRLMTRTLQDVEKEMDNWRPDWAVQNDEMMPYFISMLTKDLRFKEKQKT